MLALRLDPSLIPSRLLAPFWYLRRQVDRVAAAGWPARRKKFYEVSVMPLALLFVIAVRLLRPLIVIRFGCLTSQRIGPFAGYVDIYLTQQESLKASPRSVDIFFHSFPICNHQLKRMWDRTLHVFQFAMHVDTLNRALPGGGAHLVPWPRLADRDIDGLLANTPPYVYFTGDEEEMGRAAVRAIGIPEGAPFVCFHARDTAYLDAIFPGLDWSRHDVKDSSISDYLPAMDELTRRGLYAVRMGAIVKEPLDTDNPKIIDYAVNYRTDFLDLYLSAKCRFFLSTATGLGTGVAMLFRRPRAVVNWVGLERVELWGPDDLIIPKGYWLTGEGRLLTIGESLDSGIGKFQTTEHFEELGIELIDNTPEEIRDLVLEMEQRLNGTWEPMAEDEQLQNRFRSLLKGSELHGVIRSRIGAKYLRHYRDLLDKPHTI